MTNTNHSNKLYRFVSINQALATYIQLRSGREALLKELQDHEQIMSNVCRTIAEDFTPVDEKSGEKLPLVLDLGDGNPRGSIVAKRGELYFIRGRNPGRPKGSKNRTTKAKEAAAESVAPASVTPVVASPDGAEAVPMSQLAALATEAPVVTTSESVAPVSEEVVERPSFSEVATSDDDSDESEQENQVELDLEQGEDETSSESDDSAAE